MSGAITTPSPEPAPQPSGSGPDPAGYPAGGSGKRVVIVGAGPAGASLALLLARHGGTVVLVEASRRFERQFRGEALMPSGLEALDRIGLWPLPAAIPQRALTGWSFVVEGQELFVVSEPMGSAWPCTLIDQAQLLRVLVAQAGRHGGFHFLNGSPVADLIETGDRVVGVVLGDGTRLEADLVIGCDGRQSLLRQKGGLPLQEDSVPIALLWFKLTAPASEPIRRWLQGRFVTMIGPTGSFALFETAAGAVQLGWAEQPGQPQGAAPLLQEEGQENWPQRWAQNCPEAARGLLLQLQADAIEGPVRLPLRVGLAPRWQRPGLLLLGDAAHPMSPLRAQGINMALRDAVVAADQLLPLLGARGPARPDPASIDAALVRIEARRLSEIRTIQRLQAREAGRADRLRRQGWLRHLLARTAPCSGPPLAWRWTSEQRRLRDGLPWSMEACMMDQSPAP